MTRKQRRLTLIGIAGLVLASAAGLVLYALSDSISLFKSPSDLIAKRPAPNEHIRLGGMVETGSVLREADGRVRFAITDGAASIKVAFQGLLPDLFREGQGIVTEGVVAENGLFLADSVLAKHDENYMPREVVDALKAEGRWQEGAGKSAGTK